MKTMRTEVKKMMTCRQCNKELPEHWSTDICLECSRENVRKIFKDNPDVKEAFIETVQELKRPESTQRMAEDTVRFMKGIQKLRPK